MSRSDLERLSKEELIELVLRLRQPDKTSRTSSKPPGDLVEVMLHGPKIGMRHDQGRLGAAGRTDRPEQVRAVVPRVGPLARPRTASHPDPHEAVLLVQAHLVLKPDLDGFD